VGTLKTDEHLWDEFEVAFTKAWMDSTEKQDTSNCLQNLKMKGEDLDEYIAEFKELMTIGGWDEKSEATMILFRNGLPKHICNACMFREKMPSTLGKWQETAHKEIIRRRAFKVMNEQLGIPFIPKKGQPSIPAKQNKTGFYAPGSDPVPMHVDATTTQKMERPGKLTDEERERLCREGRCFQCRKQGHMSRECPNYPNQPRAGNPRVNEITMETTEATPPSLTFTQDKDESKAAFVRRVTKTLMTQEEQVNLLTEELEEGIEEEEEEEDF